MFPVLVIMMVCLIVALVVALFMINNGLASNSGQQSNTPKATSNRPRKDDPFAAFSEELFKDEEAKSEKDDSSDNR